jgi:hypothetical protein
MKFYPRWCNAMKRRQLGIFLIFAGIAALLVLTLLFLSVSLGGACFQQSDLVVCYWRMP